MGGGAWTTQDFVSYSHRTCKAVNRDGTLLSSYKAQDLFKSRHIQPELNPYKVIRQCCDTDEHPNTIPVILALDVTGSMGSAAAEVAKKLNEVMTNLYDKVSDVEFLIMGIGDLAYDDAPIQASQFESDVRIAEQLDKIYFEGGGGGNGFESYTAAWYFGLKHADLDCWKRGKKGIIITIYGINTIPTEYIGLIASRSLIEHFIADFREMQSVTDMKNWSEIKNCFNTIVFEGGQGLALDENNISAFPHVTASKTTSLIPIQRVKDVSCDVEICYVSRSYFTKHGAGELPTECLKTEINKDIEDRTNVRNYFQEEIRYGRFDINEFLSRVQSDISTSKNIVPNLKTSLLITHLNYTNDIAGDCTIKDLAPYFDKVYRSYSKYPEEIIKC